MQENESQTPDRHSTVIWSFSIYLFKIKLVVIVSLQPRHTQHISCNAQKDTTKTYKYTATHCYYCCLLFLLNLPKVSICHTSWVTTYHLVDNRFGLKRGWTLRSRHTVVGLHRVDSVSPALTSFTLLCTAFIYPFKSACFVFITWRRKDTATWFMVTVLFTVKFVNRNQKILWLKVSWHKLPF